MPQINNGKSPPWVSGEIVTAAELNGMIDSATINPSVITDQTNLTTLTNNEYALIVDTSGFLKKTQLKNINEAGVVTDSITGNTSTSLQIKPLGTSNSLVLWGGSSGGFGQQTGDIELNSENLSIHSQTVGINAGNGVVISSPTLTTNSRVYFNNVGGMVLPQGSTSERASVPSSGEIRFNTTTQKLEFYDGSNWKSVQSQISSGMLLYDVYEEVGVTVSAITHTKPLGELWIVEIQTAYNSGFSHLKFPTYSAASESIFLGGSSATDWITFKRVYNASTTFTSQTFGFWHWTGNIPTFSNSNFRIYKYKTA